MEGIKNIISLLWQDLINLIYIFSKKEGSEEIIDYSKNLKKEGIIRMQNYIAPSFADYLKQELKDLAQKNPKSVDLENGTKFNYRNQNDPNGSDSGMLDIFFAENLIPEISDINQGKLIQILRNVTGQEIIPLRANAYLNNGIKNTRTYHIDNTQPVIYKAFIYLSDVPDISYGPYSFIRRSHRFSCYTYLNLFINIFKTTPSTTMTIYRNSRIEDAIGGKGDLILSNQNGMHRGLPQKEGNERVALIFSFMVKSRLSYIHKSAKENIDKSKTRASKK